MKKYLNYGIAGILFILTAVIMVFINNGSIVSFDDKIYSIVTNTTNVFLDNMFLLFTFFASTKFVIGACVALLIFMKNKKNAGIMVGSVIISTITNVIIKNIFKRPRPNVRRLVIEKSFSFPSGHTMASVTLYGILIFFILKSNLNKTAKTILSILLGLMPICVAISRIYLGAHFASDVIGGAFIASGLLLCEVTIIGQLGTRPNCSNEQ